MVSYKGLTYRGSAAFIQVQIYPSMSYKVVVKKNGLYRFLPNELPRNEVAVQYYESLKSLGVHLVLDRPEGDSDKAETHDNVGTKVTMSSPAQNDEVKLDVTTEIGVDSDALNKLNAEQNDAQLVNQVKSEMTDEALMEYLDSNFTEAQLKDLAEKHGIEITQSSESVSVQLVSKKNTELLKFISTQL